MAVVIPGRLSIALRVNYTCILGSWLGGARWWILRRRLENAGDGLGAKWGQRISEGRVDQDE